MISARMRTPLALAIVTTAVLSYFAPAPDGPVQATEHRSGATTEATPTRIFSLSQLPEEHGLLSLRERDGRQFDEQFFWTPAPTAAIGPRAASAPAPAARFPFEVVGRFIDGDKAMYLLSASDGQETVAVGDKVGRWQVEDADEHAMVVVETETGVRENIPVGTH